MIKYGFLIKDGQIYDTKIISYSLGKKVSGKNIIYFMEPSGNKRLYLFEPLLHFYLVEKVFEILKFNRFLKKQRKSAKSSKNNRLHYMSNMAMVSHYPPTFLTQKRFYLYKTIQLLKKRID